MWGCDGRGLGGGGGAVGRNKEEGAGRGEESQENSLLAEK